MALCAAIIDADRTTMRSLNWGWWHIECMTKVALAHYPELAKDGVTSPLDVWSFPALQSGLDVAYSMGFKDPYDGEVLIFNAGDRLEVWRDR
jgi:hypothetical protein